MRCPGGRRRAGFYGMAGGSCSNSGNSDFTAEAQRRRGKPKSKSESAEVAEGKCAVPGGGVGRAFMGWPGEATVNRATQISPQRRRDAEENQSQSRRAQRWQRENALPLVAASGGLLWDGR